MTLNEQFFLSHVPSARIVHNAFPLQGSFVVDSRHVKHGDIFIALRGSKCDGHDFIEEALNKGCSGLVIASDKQHVLDDLGTQKLKHIGIIAVPDTLQALVDLASAWRQCFTVPVIAITGSVGKTSTKTLLGSIIEHSGKNYVVSHGNQNTVIGVALNILRLTDQHDGAIFEVGINQRGEMAKIVAMLRPTSALITCIGHSHMEGLGSLRDIALEKRDIFKYLNENNVGFVNGDLPILAHVSYPHPVVKFGLKTSNQIQARKVSYESFSTSCILKIYKDKYRVTLPTNHAGALLNTLGAVAIASHIGIAHTAIVEAIKKPTVVAGRFERRGLKKSKGFLINDCYNASPESMKAALLAFEKCDTQGQKIAVLGDMLELGSNSAFWHRQLGRFIRKVSTIRHVILVGSLVQWTHKTLPFGVSATIVPSWQEALALLEHQMDKEAVVLVKGSNGIGLHNVVESLSVSDYGGN